MGRPKRINSGIVDQDIDMAVAKLDRFSRNLTELAASSKSDAIKSACPPVARIPAIVFSPRSALRPTTKTWTPNWANLLAVARPMPLVPPVMSAIVVIS
jgi:hypothetical protein